MDADLEELIGEWIAAEADAREAIARRDRVSAQIADRSGATIDLPQILVSGDRAWIVERRATGEALVRRSPAEVRVLD